MIWKMRLVLRRMLSRIHDHVEHAGSVLPAPRLRWCGAELRDNAKYIESCEGEARRLVSRFGCTSTSAVLDIGCGQGRLPIGILRVLGELSYCGMDVDPASIAWCRRHIGRDHPSFRFEHLDVGNERYNPGGRRLGQSFRFQYPDGAADVIYLFSVFSHMQEADARVYLKEFRRMLKDDGRVFFTTFVEEDVPPMTVNPESYAFSTCSGPLHVVRYSRPHLFAILQAEGFEVTAFEHRSVIDGQSAVELRKRLR